MFGFPENEMQEAEKLCELFDRMRKYARDKNIVVVCATAHHQPAPDVTDFTFTFVDQRRDAALDYIGVIRTKERPLAGTLKVDMDRLLKYDMTLPIGFTPLRAGATQTFNDAAPDEVVESIESQHSQFIKATAEKYGINPDILKSVLGFESAVRLSKMPVVGLHHDQMCYDIECDVHSKHAPGLVVASGRSHGRPISLMDALASLANEHKFRAEKIPGFDADFDGQVHVPKRYLSKQHYWGEGADTAESGARKRRQSDVHTNGRPKKGWQK